MSTAGAAPASPPLDYAQCSSANRRWIRQIMRRWWIGALLLTLSLAYIYGPRAWRHYQLLRLQHACLTADLPNDRPICEFDLTVSQALLVERNGEYRRGCSTEVVRADPRWIAFSQAIKRSASSIPTATLFLHERCSANGQRRLVVVETRPAEATVIEPAGLFSLPRIIACDSLVFDDQAQAAIMWEPQWVGRPHFGAGVPDVLDKARFAIPYTSEGITALLECRLEDDGQVSVTCHDPIGFRNRVRDAAKKRIAATDSATPLP